MLLKKLNKTKIIVLAIIILAIIIAIMSSVINSPNIETIIEIAEIEEKYFLVEENLKYGVIDLERKYNN